MNEKTKQFYKNIEQQIALAADQLSDIEYMELLGEIENMANANYNAMEEQLRNEVDDSD